MNLKELNENAMEMYAEFLNEIGLNGKWYSGLKKTPLIWGMPLFGAAGEFIHPNNPKIGLISSFCTIDKETEQKCKSEGLIVISNIFKNMEEPSRELFETLIHENIHANRLLLLDDVYRNDQNQDAYINNNGRFEQNTNTFSSRYVDASQQVFKGSIDTSRKTIQSYEEKTSDEIEDSVSVDKKIQRQIGRQHVVDEALVELMAELSYKMYDAKKNGEKLDVWDAIKQVKEDRDISYLSCEASKKDNLKENTRIMCDILLRHHDFELFYWMVDPINYSNGDIHYDFFSEYTKNDQDLLNNLYGERRTRKKFRRFVREKKDKRRR